MLGQPPAVQLGLANLFEIRSAWNLVNPPNTFAAGYGFRSTEALGFRSSRFTRHIPESPSRRAFANKGKIANSQKI
jgi:hypothetical protein